MIKKHLIDIDYNYYVIVRIENDDGYTYGKIMFDDIVARKEGDEEDEIRF